VTVERADGLKDRDKIGKSDPYMKVDFGGSSHKTKTVKNNLAPEWNETFEFHLDPNAKKELLLKVKDSDIGFDDTIGEAIVNPMDLPHYSGEEKKLRVNLKRKDELSGVAYLRVKKMGGPQQQPQQYQQQQQGYGSQEQPQHHYGN